MTGLRALESERPVRGSESKGLLKKHSLKTKEDQEFIIAQGPSFVLKLMCEK